MERRNFLSLTATVLPALSFSQTIQSSPPGLKKGFVVKSAKSRYGEKTLLGGKNPNDIKVSSKDTNGGLTIFEYTGNEKGGPPLHIHPKQDEIFIIIEGKYLFQCGDDKHTLETGDTIFLPRNIPHAFAQLSEKGKMLFMFQPSGKMEDFFRVLGSLQSQPTPAEGAKIFSEHEMNIVGPPLEF